MTQHRRYSNDCAACWRGKHTGQKRATGVEMGKCVYGKAARDLGGREGEKGFAVYDAGVVD